LKVGANCKAFAHVPKEQQLKLNDKAFPCTFVGYGDAEFGYKLWDPKKDKIIRSRDVVFHEIGLGHALRNLKSQYMPLKLFLSS